jgi:P4 family phage/plasmid primase-like protien
MTLTEFLNAHRVQEKGSPYTHTGLSPMLGKYYIPPTEQEEFFKCYNNALSAGLALTLTEVHQKYSPILIDLDFRFDLDSNLTRKYTTQDIENIINLFNEQINHFFNIENSYEVYVFEKPEPTRSNGNVKDGIHIMYPTIVSEADIQFEIRKRVVDKIKQCNIFQHIGSKNSVDDIVDKAVIQKNNWLMYGSGKDASSKRYVATKVYKCENDQLEVSSIPSEDSLTKLLSIYKDSTQKTKQTDAFKTDNNPENVSKPTPIQVEYMVQGLQSDVDTAKNLIELLSDERAENYNSWIEVGFCLHNIDHSLLDAWLTFSERSEKYKTNECETLWTKFRNQGLTIASLYRWAKIDSPDEYNELKRNEISISLIESLSGTNFDVANVLYTLYKHEYVCASMKYANWFQYSNHRWVELDKGIFLRQKISTKLAHEYKKLSQYYKTKAIDDVNNSDQYKEKYKKCEELIFSVKSTNFKDKVMTECAELFYDPLFLNKLDSNLHLLGFDNGVYDFKQSCFRNGSPDDYISYSLKTDYVQFDSSSVEYKEIQLFMSQILPSVDVRQYVLKLMSSFLHGRIGDQKFHIWTGSGANGKSTLIELFECSAGDYCCKLPTTVLTQKRGSSSGASPEIAKTKGKRFASMQEPEETDKINVGYMKELSGGDKIQARALYKEPVEFIPQFKMILCCNNLPAIPSNDGGTWRRLRVCHFPSKFVDNPSADNEYKKDDRLKEKMETWRGMFISLLLETYKLYKSEGLREPESVLTCTRDYQRRSDVILEFLGETIIQTDDKKDIIGVMQIFQTFRQWHKENFFENGPGRNELSAYLSTYFAGQKGPWKGYKFKDSEIHDDIL